MRLQYFITIAVATAIAGIKGSQTISPNEEVKVATPDHASFARSFLSESKRGETRKLRDGEDNDVTEDEDRGFLSNAKLELWLKLGYDPAKAYKKLRLPRTYLSARDHKNWEQMKKFYEMWLNKMAAKKPPTKV